MEVNGMLCLYAKHHLPEHLIDIKVPWDTYFIQKKVTKTLDTTDIQIVKTVEMSNLLNTSTIYGKFSDIPIGIGELSVGCKTLLCINHAIKYNKTAEYLFNITSCGGNAINYLITEMARSVDIYCYCEHKDFGKNKKNVEIKLGDKLATTILDAKQIYMDICREDFLWEDTDA